jgi:hypothetical protein
VLAIPAWLARADCVGSQARHVRPAAGAVPTEWGSGLACRIEARGASALEGLRERWRRRTPIGVRGRPVRNDWKSMPASRASTLHNCSIFVVDTSGVDGGSTGILQRGPECSGCRHGSARSFPTAVGNDEDAVPDASAVGQPDGPFHGTERGVRSCRLGLGRSFSRPLVKTLDDRGSRTRPQER